MSTRPSILLRSSNLDKICKQTKSQGSVKSESIPSQFCNKSKKH